MIIIKIIRKNCTVVVLGAQYGIYLTDRYQKLKIGESFSENQKVQIAISLLITTFQQ